MNKHMTLEEMQDAKAYPLKRTIKHPGKTWAQMAKEEGHRGRVPPSCIARDEVGRQRRATIAEAIKEHGPMTSKQIADATGIAVENVRQYLNTMMGTKTLVSEKPKCRPHIYRLAK